MTNPTTIQRCVPILAIALLALFVSSLGAATDPFQVVGQEVTKAKTSMKPILETICYIAMGGGVVMLVVNKWFHESRGLVIGGFVSLGISAVGLALLTAFMA